MARSKARRKPEVALLIGTVKGGYVLRRRGARWSLDDRGGGPHFLGSRVHDLRLDPRDGKTLLLASTGGHLGPTIYRSGDRGRSWKEAARPPRFKKLPKGKKPGKKTAARGMAVDFSFWLTPGHESEPGVWYVGTSPQGLFRSNDGGDTWRGVDGFNDSKRYWDWTAGGKNPTPAGALLHSVCVDPRAKEHMLLSLSIGGTFESHDHGKSWAPLNEGVAADFLPVKEPEYGQDPHCLIMHPADPGRLYQQNHCGIYRLDRDQGTRWKRIGRALPRKIGDIGFPIVGHPRDPDTVWVFPMDGTEIWPRTSPDGRPAVYRTRNGGRSWQRLDAGLPEDKAWLTVLRQAMDATTTSPRGRTAEVYFGTTSGEVWASRDEGESWTRIAEHLPKIFSLRVAGFL